MNENNTIYEINESDFEEKVIKASSSILILVDFWAPWCGPCKQLAPLLEKIIKGSKGKVGLVKINIDENKQIAAQLRIQSIPAVFAFKDGQPVDAFQGVVPEKKIIEFIEKSLGEKIEEDHTDFYNSISIFFNENKFLEAKEMLENFLTNNPSEFQSFAIYIDCLSQLKNYEEANNFSTSLSTEALSNKYIKASIKKLKIKIKNSQGPSVDDIYKKYLNEPDNIELVLKLADKYFSENMHDDAFSLLLDNYKKEKNKIKIKFLDFFEALGNEDEKTKEYRKKFSSIMFT